MDLTYGGWPRRLVRAGALAGAAGTLCLAALAPRWSPPTTRPGHGHGGTRRPSPAAAGRAGPPAPAPRRPRSSPWLINPDAPLSRPSHWRPVLAVAHRFAAAYLSYEVGATKPAVSLAITGTCTVGFAAQLLSDRASLPPGVRAGQVRQRLVAVVALEGMPGVAVTLVTVRSSDADGRTLSAFELRLVRDPARSRRWRVAGITVL